ncbi:MAG: type 1 glutamine amidotransferase [Candidatus Competibacteraceae bacterium]|jgi:putative glutamine amidotransferase|nr:type 1 glutamine amidotransferase [Candidatus Competibacteraceae bacterium]
MSAHPKRPVIGITTPNKRFHVAYFFIKFSVWLCGGKALPLRTLEGVESKKVDGLVLGGGTDIFPGLFQSDPKQHYFYDHQRDEMEIAWLRKAEREKIPVFAICRGAQLVNVINKGTLHLDASVAYDNFVYPEGLLHKIFYRKLIRIKQNSQFYKLVSTDRLCVNSMHMQSIDKVGDNLEISAQEDNGVVQAIERPTQPFYLGVQFHPEFLIYRSSMRNLFKQLVKVASRPTQFSG